MSAKTGRASTSGGRRATGWSCPLTAIVVGMVALSISPVERSPLTTEAITVYDCGHDNATFEAIDLHEPAACPDPIRDYHPPYNATVQILQTDTELPILGYQCIITITREVTRCGFNSITYGHTTPVWEQAVEVTPEECRKAVEQGDLVIRVTVGERMDESYFSHGYVDREGNCQTASFESGGEQFEHSYEKTKLSALVRVARGTADIAEGTVTFTSGITARYKDEVLRDAFEGTIVWTADEPPCSSTVSEVYMGDSQVHQRVGARNLAGAILRVTGGGRRSDQYAGLVLGEASSVCGAHCWTTQIHGPAPCLPREGDQPLPPQHCPPSLRPE